MISDVSNASLMSAVSTNSLAKTMQTSENLAANLLNGLENSVPTQGDLQTSSQNTQNSKSSNALDFYA